MAGEAHPLDVIGDRVDCDQRLDLGLGTRLGPVEADEDFGMVNGLGDVDGRPSVVAERVVARLGRARLALIPVIPTIVARRIGVAEDDVSAGRRGRV